ncbi:hypothetical protein J31TS6_62370 [Brevibacillus reuszeri]|nr:hypothetical protein J31TS6_62370 [Brevibacillus reuszeri]
MGFLLFDFMTSPHARNHVLQLGEHPKVVSERLGHSRVGITMDVYSHVMPDMQKDAADNFEKLMKQKLSK